MIRTALLCAAACATATASAAEVRTFALGNHPDGSASPPPYGLRLDGLFGGGTTTFSFDTMAGVELTVTDATMDGGDISIEIAGTVFGGQVSGGAYVDGGNLYDIAFVYTASVQETSSGWKVTGTNNGNSGSITLQGSSDPEDVLTITDDNNNAFVFQADGHRLAGDNMSWVGRGWLTSNDDGTGVSGTQDWLFTATETTVPTPGALGLATLGGLLAARRRRA